VLPPLFDCYWLTNSRVLSLISNTLNTEIGRLIFAFVWLSFASHGFDLILLQLETYRTCTGRYTYLIMPTSPKRRCGSHPRLLLHHVRVFCRLIRLFRFPNCQPAAKGCGHPHSGTRKRARVRERNHPQSHPQPPAGNALLLFCLLLAAGAFYGQKERESHRKL